jgi:hypothetical protein
MKALTITEAVRDLAEWLKWAVAGEGIAIQSDDAVVALRPLAGNGIPQAEPLASREALRLLQQEAHLTPVQAKTTFVKFTPNVLPLKSARHDPSRYELSHRLLIHGAREGIMKTLLTPYLSLGVMIIVGASSTFAKDPPQSVDELRGEVESAFRAKDVNAMISLVCWDGAANGAKEMTSGMTGETMRTATNIISVTLSALPTNFQTTVSSFNPDWEGDDGRRGKYNLPVIGVIRLNFQDGKSDEMPYGKKGDAYYIAQLVEYRIPGKDLRVDVSKLRVQTYTGYWVYVQSGKEISISISDQTNELKSGWGDYVKYCYVRRTDTNEVPGFSPWFNYRIREDVTNYIFDSGLITNEEPVIYERK